VRRLTWQEVAEQLDDIGKRDLRVHLQRMSLADQLQFWGEVQSLYPKRYRQAEDASNAIVKRLADMRKMTPSGGAWDDDVESIPPGSGGEFPPGGRDTLMKRAKGERRVYPPQYLTTSGHSYDIYVQHVYLGRTQTLLEEAGGVPINDGYRGSLVRINDLPQAERQRYRRASNGKHGASNSIDWDRVPD
jgi:hypothetical protein